MRKFGLAGYSRGAWAVFSEMKPQAKKSHYETLGVDPSASPEEIKRVYRKKAATAHPDKQTGDQETMAALNHAYDVLSDPGRRLLYDKTGDDSQKPEQELIRTVLTAVFSDGLQKDVPHILNHAKQLLKEGQATMEGQVDEVTKRRDKLKVRREKIVKKSGENVFQMIIDQQLASFDQNLAKLEVDLDICHKAMAELKKYKSSEEVPTYGLADLRFSSQWVSTAST